MQSGWSQIKQSTTEFFTDATLVSDNALGGSSHWPLAITVENESRYQRFKNAMMEGTRFYSEESTNGDRIMLGLGAAGITCVYLPLRLIYDGGTNIIEYGSHRLGCDANFGRGKREYILGAPLSAPFIAALIGAEFGIRTLGLNSYGAQIIKTAHMRSANILGRYACHSYTPDEIKAQEAKLAAKPATKWNYVDRINYLTLPGVVAGLEVIGAIGLKGGLTVGETIGRTIGLTEYGGEIVKAAHMRSANILGRYACHTYNLDEIKAQESKLTAKPPTNWNYIDRAGYVTLPGIVAGLEIAGAVGLKGGLTVGEVIGRTLGLTEYGAEIVKASHMRSANIMGRYACKTYSADEIKEQNAKLTAAPKTNWNYIDRAGLVTLPGVVASAELIGALGAKATMSIGELAVRTLGFTEYGGEIIKAAHMRSATILGRYSCSSFTVDEIKEQEAKLTAKPITNWNYIDRAGLVTLPGVVAALEVVGAIGLKGGLTIGEAIGRAAGFTEYGGEIIKAAAMRSANVIGRYACKTYTPDEMKAQHAKLTATPNTNWNYIDRAGFVTLPGIVAGLVITGALGAKATMSLGEVTLRTMGFTEYGGDIIKAAHMRSTNIMGRYAGTTYSSDEIKAQNAKLTATPKTNWNYIDRAGFITLPGIAAGLEVTGALGAKVTLSLGEAMGRTLGLTEYGADIVKASHMRSANIMGRYTCKTYTPDEIKEQNTKLTIAPKTNWNYLDRAGFITLPGIVAATEMIGAIGAKTAMSFGEAIVRATGFTEYGSEIIKAAHMRSVNLLGRYSCGRYTVDEIKEQETKLTAKPATNWNYIDRAGFVTLPGLVAALEVVGAMGLKQFLTASEVIGRTLGFTEYGGEIIKAGHMRASNIIKRYSSFAYTPEEIKEQNAKLKASPETKWNYIDRAAFITLPGAIAATENAIALGLSGLLHTGEASIRSLGISNKSKDLFTGAMSYVGNMFGCLPAPNLSDKAKSLKAPIKSAWDVFDTIGLLPSGVLSLAVGVLGLPPALIGFSKSNWHRTGYYIEHIKNLHKDRREQKLDKTKELYHKEALAKCESTTTGKVFSKLNVLNVSTEIVVNTLRYIAAPLTYGTIRLVKNHGLGVVPIYKAISHAISPPKFNIANPFDRIRRKLKDLLKSLDKYGHLPDLKGETDLRSAPMQQAIEKAHNRSRWNKFKFSAFTEGRKIMSLGHTIEERVIKEFKTKFEEFAKVCKKKKIMEANSFFTNDVRLKNGERFSFEKMVARIEGSYSSSEEKAIIRKIAAMVRSDVEKEMQVFPTLVSDNREFKTELPDLEAPLLTKIAS